MKNWFDIDAQAASSDTNNPAVNRFLDSSSELQAAVYAAGLFTLTTEADSQKLLLPFKRDIGTVECLLTTGLGNAFFWRNSDQSVYFLNSQYGTYSFVDKEVSWVLFEFLKNVEVQQSVLEENKFRKVAAICGKPIYGECCFPVPFLISGGTDKVEKFQKGNSEVYFSLLAQTRGSGSLEYVP